MAKMTQARRLLLSTLTLHGPIVDPTGHAHVQLYELMQRAGYTPNRNCFNALLKVAVQDGLVSRVKRGTKKTFRIELAGPRQQTLPEGPVVDLRDSSVDYAQLGRELVGLIIDISEYETEREALITEIGRLNDELDSAKARIAELERPAPQRSSERVAQLLEDLRRK